MLNMVNPGGVVQVGSGTVFAPNNNRVVYVHHNLPSISELDPGIAEYGRTSIPAAIDLVRSGRGDIIQLLPGHTESISSADYMSTTGTKTDFIVRGPATGAPATLTWTTATSTWLFDTAGVVLDGRRPQGTGIVLNMEPGTGTVTVAAPITISAARCAILGCRARTSTDSNNLTTIALALTDDADDCVISDNRFYGATAGECTTQVDIAGADRLIMERNVFEAATVTQATVGTVRFKTTAATNIILRHNTYINRAAGSACAVTGVAAVTGVSFEELFCYLDDSTTTMWVTSPGNMFFYNPRTVNLAGEAGMLSTVVST